MVPSVRSSRLALVVVLAAAVLALAGCGGSKRAASSATTTPSGTANLDRWGTTWLCRPGLKNNPCLSDLTTTVVGRNGVTHVVHGAPAKGPPVDCFYVYPTISDQKTVNANLEIGFRQQEVAIAQASPFSQVCNVYAPVYRQITLAALDHPHRITPAAALLAYGSVLAAFRDYLAHYNDGRGIVFIGHSQGATILIRLLQHEVDNRPALRSRLVSALLLGGNVTVEKGKTVGGDFSHIPECTRSNESGCVVAYSSFTARPPADSQFARTTSDEGVDLLAPRNLSPKLEIMCVNPASPSGGIAFLEPAIPSLALTFLAGSRLSVKTPWVSFPREFTGRCETSGNATWLQVSRPGGSADHRPTLAGLQQPILGLHVLDVNIALGDLVRLAGDQAVAYRHRS
jgi:hypothetical protein